MVYFYSTNHSSPNVDFKTALIQGIAPDGGLYFPKKFPKFTKLELTNIQHEPLKEVAASVLKKWINDSIEREKLKTIVEKVFNFPIILRRVGPFYILELYHGPTLSSKDLAARCLAYLIDNFTSDLKHPITFICASSGDTGGAIAQAFSQTTKIRVIILFPKGRVTLLQEEQMTRVTDNVLSIAVKGTVDDCQNIIRQAFADPDLNNLHLTSANSINIGRIIPQIIYYVYTYALLPSHRIQFIVPSGNLGNITAGLFAAQMNLPFNTFITAVNPNSPMLNYYQTGKFQPQVAKKTFSNTMDIGNPSNFSRILELFKKNHSAFVSQIKTNAVSDEEAISTLKRVYRDYNYLLDPTASIAWTTAEKLAAPDKIPVIVATISPIKFYAEIQQATGIRLSDQSEIEYLRRKPKKVREIDLNYQTLKKLLLEFHTNNN